MVISISGLLLTTGINLKLNTTALFKSCTFVSFLCTVVRVILSTLEKLQQNLHLMGVLLKAAQQGIVSHDRLQNVRLHIILEEVLFAVCRDHHSFIQHLHSNIWTHDRHIKKKKGVLSYQWISNERQKESCGMHITSGCHHNYIELKIIVSPQAVK